MPDLSDLRRSLDRAAVRYPAERTNPATLNGRPAPSVRRLPVVPMAAAVVVLLIAGIAAASVAAAGSSGHAKASHRLQVTGPGPAPAPAATAAPAPVLPLPPQPRGGRAAVSPPTTAAIAQAPPASAQPPGHLTPTTTAPPTSTTTVTAPDGGRGGTAPPTPCATSQLSITITKTAEEFTEHDGYILLFTNTGQTSCTLDGYPSVEEIDNGTGVYNSSQELQGFMGGPSSIAVVTLAPSATGSALWEGISPTVQACQSYTSLSVTPPGATEARAVNLIGMAQVCQAQIHPIVAGNGGGQFG